MLAPETRLKDRYRILQRIGGGGFGYVYKAIDETFGCSVAIKETREEIADQVKLRRAFEREARLLRNLKHDALPRVTDYFFEGQAQFLVMDFIEGEDLASLLSQRLREHQGPFTFAEILPWADKILDALEYLHSRPEPIIHRDIKPANIKIADDGEVYLLDFGLAKGVAGQMSTVIDGQASSVVVGFTREYAPLEQLQDTANKPQSDVFAFAATLYHLLTGELPIAATQRDEALQRGQGDPLRPAHQVNPGVPSIVSQIISQGLVVRWWDRTASAGELRAALANGRAQSAALHLELPAGLGLQSGAGADQRPPRTPTTPQQESTSPNLSTRTHLRRSLVALVLVALFAGLSVVSFLKWRAPVASRPAAQPSPSPAESNRARTPANLAFSRVLRGHTGQVWSLAFSRDGAWAASASEDQTVIVWETSDWHREFTLTGHTGPVYSVTFSPNRKTLATASHDKTIRLWDLETNHSTVLREHTKPVLLVAFSPDGHFLASFSGERGNGDRDIRLWDTRDWTSKKLKGHEDAVNALAFSADSQSLISAGYDYKLRLWILRDDEPNIEIGVFDEPLNAFTFSPDNRYLAAGTDKVIRLWKYLPQLRKAILQELLDEHTASITCLAFAPDSKTLASASKDKTLRLWDVESGSSKLLSAKQGEVQSWQRSIAFSPDGQTLLTGGADGTITVWR